MSGGHAESLTAVNIHVVPNIIVSAHMHAYVQIRSIDQPYTTLKLLNK